MVFFYDFFVIQFFNGKFVLIGDVVEELFNKYFDRIKMYKDLEYIEFDFEDQFEVVSVGLNLKVGKYIVMVVWCRKVWNGEKLIRIRMRMGNEVILMKIYLFFVFSDGDVVRKEVEKVRLGDRVVVMMRFFKVFQSLVVVFVEVYVGISDYYFVLNGNGMKKVFNRGVLLEDVEYLLFRNLKLVKFVCEVGISFVYVVGVILGDGYFLLDGYNFLVIFDDFDYMNFFILVMLEFLLELVLWIKDNGMSMVVIYGFRIFNEMLLRIFGILRGKKLLIWDVFDVVFMNDDFMRYFIVGLFDVDGFVDEIGFVVILIIKSESVVRKIWYVFQRFGIISIVFRVRNRGFKEGYIFRVIISSVEDLKKFDVLILFFYLRKWEKLKVIFKEKWLYCGRYIYWVFIFLEMIKFLCIWLNLMVVEFLKLVLKYVGEIIIESLIRYVEKGRMFEIRCLVFKGIVFVFQRIVQDIGDEDVWVMVKRFELIVDGDVYWDRVVEVEEVDFEEIGIEYLYDLIVDEDYNYVVNGIFLLNCMGIIYVNSVCEIIVRFESLLMSVLRIMIFVFDIIFMQVCFYSRKKGMIRCVIEIVEVFGLEGESIQFNIFYKYDFVKDEFVLIGVLSRMVNILVQYIGMSVREIEFEIEKCRLILEWMVEKGIRDIDKVGYYIRQFYIDEEWFFNKIFVESDVEISKQIQVLM